jgi:hypothetical protein
LLNNLKAQTFNPVADTYIRGGDEFQNINFGTDTLLYVKQGNQVSFFRKALLKFELQNFDFDTLSIDKAILRLYLESGDTAIVSAFEYGNNWEEAALTWSSADEIETKITETKITAIGKYYEWDITSYLQTQTDFDGIISIAMFDEYASSANLKFSSREADENLPELLIEASKLIAPKAPSNLVANVTSNTSIKLSWNDNSSDETGFILERKMEDGAFSKLADIETNTISFEDLGLNENTVYYYRVAAYNELDTSSYSSEVYATTTFMPVVVSYYIDALNGDDANDGLSAESAWQTLDKVNATTFVAGNTILFKSGDIWTGQLYPKGSGNGDAVITIDKYGGDDKPIIDGDGMEGTGVVYLYNQEYWEINNLEITNDADSAGDRRGVRIEIDNFGTAHHIYLQDLHIHDIRGSIGQERTDKRTSGIGYAIVNAGIESHFDDILVEGCLIHDCENQGIITEYVPGGGYYPGTDEWENIKITNAAIRNNTIYGISKNAIIVRLWEHGVVENNVCYNTANGITGNTIFSAACDSTVFQFNEGYENNTPDYDGALYDADIRSPRTVWQYSYSHDNMQGLFISCTDQADVDVVCRYNISQNDKGRIVCINYPGSSVYVYNNTFYVGDNLAPEVIAERSKGGSGTRTYSFLNNIVYNRGSATYDVSTAGYTRYIVNNCFYGNHDATEPDDVKKITGDPMFVNPGSGEYGINTVDGYKLQAGSSCINTGINISGSGGFDYWGNELSDGLTDIGAHEYVSDNVSLIDYKNTDLNSVNIYPNPLKDNTLNIDLSNIEDLNNVQVLIMNCNGQLVYQSSFTNESLIKIEADKLTANSIYFVSVKTNRLIINKKFIRE